VLLTYPGVRCTEHLTHELGGMLRTYAVWDMHNQILSQTTPWKNTCRLQKKDLVLGLHIVRKDVPCKNHKGVASLQDSTLRKDTRKLFPLVQKLTVQTRLPHL
jgi:hypothetical protein